MSEVPLRFVPGPLAALQNELALRYRAGDRRVGDELARACDPVCKSRARFVRRVTQGRYEFDDLYQAARVGILVAVPRWNPERASFATLLYVEARRAVWDYCIKAAPLKLPHWVADAVRRASVAGVEAADAASLAEAGYLKQSANIVKENVSFRTGTVSLDVDSDDGRALRDRIPSPNADPEEQLIDADLKAYLRGSLKKSLTDREMRVLELRVLADDQWTLEEVGAEFGVTRERARQIEASLRLKLAKKVRTLPFTLKPRS